MTHTIDPDLDTTPGDATHPEPRGESESLTDRILELQRQARDAGHPPPGRGALASATGASTHRVRVALRSLARGAGPNQPTTATPTTTRATTTPAARGGGGGGRARRGTPTARNPAPAATATSSSTASSGARTDTTPGAAPGGRVVAWAGFVFGSIMSIAANVLHTWLPATTMPAGWAPAITAQIGAAVWPIALLLSVEVLARVTWRPGAHWALARYGGTGTVALGSATISYGHVHDLLTAWGYNPLAAHVGPLVLDGLMVISGFALLAMTHHQAHPGDGRRQGV